MIKMIKFFTKMFLQNKKNILEGFLLPLKIAIILAPNIFSKLEKDVGAGLIALDTSGACPE